MAHRKVFLVDDELHSYLYVKEVNVEFQWFPGYSLQQKQKSIMSLHNEFSSHFPTANILEISSKSNNTIGVKLSAFNLIITHKNSLKKFSVESAYQSSKVFESAGPFLDILDKCSLDAKRDSRLKNSGDLISFKFYNSEWGLEPKTAFYDWLYVNALYKHKDLVAEVIKYSAFSDIEFNSKKSFNCQAKAAALFVSLYKRDFLEKAIESQNSFLDIVYGQSNLLNKDSREITNQQLSIFDNERSK